MTTCQKTEVNKASASIEMTCSAQQMLDGRTVENKGKLILTTSEAESFITLTLELFYKSKFTFHLEHSIIFCQVTACNLPAENK